MLRFDETTGTTPTLYAYRNELGLEPDLEISEHIDSIMLKEYCKEQLINDVHEIFIPQLRKVLNIDEFDLAIKDVVVKQEDAGYFDNKDLCVKVKFVSTAITGESEYLTILRIPWVDNTGILWHDRKKYSLIKMLEQEETISFNDDKAGQEVLKLKTNRGDISIVNTKSGYKMEVSALQSKTSRKKYGLINVLFAMAKAEGIDPIDAFMQFKNIQIVNAFKTNEDMQRATLFYSNNVGSINADEYDDEVVPYLTGTKIHLGGAVNTMYSIKNLRDELNHMLSLDRADGKILAEDVESVLYPGKIVARAGTQITNSLLATLKANGVWKIYVDNTPNIEGYYLATKIFLNHVPIGTKMIPELAPYMPEEKGMYVSKDYDFSENPIIFDDNIILTKSLIDLFIRCGYTQVTVSTKKGNMFGKEEDNKKIYFSEEIISNRHFKKADVGFTGETYSSWVYLNEDNQFEECRDFLNTYDIMGLISLFAKLTVGDCRNIVANVDTGFRKRLILLDTQYHRALERCVSEGFKQMNRKFKEVWKADRSRFFNADEMDGNFYPFHKKFFEYLRDDAKCLQMLTADSLTNPVAYVSATTKVNVYTKSSNSVADSQRRIPIGSYGKVDPYEVSQSGKLGVVLNSSTGCQIDKHGTMRTSYYEVKHFGGRSKIDKTKVFLSITEEESYNIASMESLVLDKDGNILNTNDIVLCRVPDSSSLEKQSFAFMPVSKIKYVNASPSQYLSWATATIPCLGSNDPARVIFGVSQIKQAKGLVMSDEATVSTPAARNIIRMNEEYCIFAKGPGTVMYIDKGLKAKKNKINGNDNLRKIKIAVHYDDQDEFDGTIYEFDEYQYTKYSVTTRQVMVREGQRLNKNDIIMKSNFVENGRLALGKEGLVGFISTGFNYEDGAHIATAFCQDLLSYRIDTEEFENIDKDSQPIISYARHGRWITPNADTCISVVYKKGGDKKRERSFKTTKAKGFLENIRVVSEKKGNKRVFPSIEVDLISIDPFRPGDKISNRHGNKGVMAKPRPTSEMPRLLNGRPLDMACNPMGVTSRMNIGQVKECHISIPAHIIGYRLEADAFNTITDEEISALLCWCHDLANSESDAEVSAINSNPKYAIIPENLKAYAMKKLEDIRYWANTFDEKGEAYLILPDNEMKLTETKATIGWIHELKLIQESEKKMHARGGMIAGEPYSVVSDAPTKGSGNHGGQRFGTMEMDAICAYGASALAQECTNECGDNAVARSNLNVLAYLPDSKQAEYFIEARGQRRSVSQFLYSALALGMYLEPTEDEFIPLDKSNSDLGYYTAKSLCKVRAEVKDAEDANNSSEDSTVTKPTKPGDFSALKQLSNQKTTTEADDYTNLLQGLKLK